MAGGNDDEYNKRVGYKYERFSQDGYHRLQIAGAAVYAEKPAYWKKLLTDKIVEVAAACQGGGMALLAGAVMFMHKVGAGKPLMTTEGGAVVDYKDWPLLPWDWVKEVCAAGALKASATGQWAAIATSNFCGPQFRGMWRDKAWHQGLTTTIKAGPLDVSTRGGRLWAPL